MPSDLTSTRSRWSPKSVERSQRRAVVARRSRHASRSASSTSATSPRSCSVRSENHVSKCTPMRPRSSRSWRTTSRTPHSRACSSVTSSPSSARIRVGHLDEVLALVAVLGRLAAVVAREERRAEQVELVAGVVQVVLAVHVGALRGEQVRDRVADGDPAAAARVQRTGRVGRDELEVDPRAGEIASPWPYRCPAATTARSTSCSHVGARKKLRKPGPAISIASTWAGAADSRAATIRVAASRGGTPAAPATWSATFVDQSPCSRCLGGSRVIPASGAGNPASSSAARKAARS